jgi:hypothetical protein
MFGQINRGKTVDELGPVVESASYNTDLDRLCP